MGSGAVEFRYALLSPLKIRRDGIHLDEHASRKFAGGNAGTGGFRGKILGIHPVECGEIGHILQVTGRFDDMVQRHARRFEYGLQVEDDPFGLAFDGRFLDVVCHGVDRYLSRCEHKTADLDCLRVGANGFWGFVGFDINVHGGIIFWEKGRDWGMGTSSVVLCLLHHCFDALFILLPNRKQFIDNIVALFGEVGLLAGIVGQIAQKESGVFLR